MSSYIDFYIKTPKNNFIPLYSFSRNDDIYISFQNKIEYGKGRPLKFAELMDVLDSANESIVRISNDILELNEKKESIATFNNTMEEKIEAIDDINDILKEYSERREDYERLKYFAIFLIDTIDNVSYRSKYNKDDFIYVGIEWCPDED